MVADFIPFAGSKKAVQRRQSATQYGACDHMLAVGTQCDVQSETPWQNPGNELEEGTGLGVESTKAPTRPTRACVHSPNGETSLSKKACKKTTNSNLRTIMAQVG